MLSHLGVREVRKLFLLKGFWDKLGRKDESNRVDEIWWVSCSYQADIGKWVGTWSWVWWRILTVKEFSNRCYGRCNWAVWRARGWTTKAMSYTDTCRGTGVSWLLCVWHLCVLILLCVFTLLSIDTCASDSVVSSVIILYPVCLDSAVCASIAEYTDWCVGT